jgi:polyisoprenoid-binding protein YceI
MKTKLITSLALAAFAGFASAAPQSFDFKDPKGVNNAVFKLDAPLEAINGSANGISGTVEFDVENPAATKGKIVVAADTLTVPNPMQKEHLHGAMWLDTATFKEITFEAKTFVSSPVPSTKAEGGNIQLVTGNVTGDFTVHGVTKTITVPMTLTYLKGKLSQRVPKMEGDLLVIRASFTIKRSDYGINPGAPTDKVSDEIELTLSIAGASPKK